MDWVALQTDPLWKEFWASEEIANKRLAITNHIVNGRYTPDQLGFLRGQLKALDSIQELVFELAKKQAIERAREDSKDSKPPDPQRFRRFRKLLEKVPEIL